MSALQLAQRLANVAAIAAERRGATHCKYGHEFTSENTYRYPSHGRRECRVCRKDRRRALLARQRAQRVATFVAAFGRPDLVPAHWFGDE